MVSRWFRNIVVLTRAACVHRLSTLGLLLAAISVVVFVLHDGLRAAGVVRNATVGLVLYLGLVTTFALGLAALMAGWWLAARKRNISLRQLAQERVPEHLRAPGTYGSPLLAALLVGGGASALLLAGGSARMLHYMDEPEFCGTACHTMAPEWAAYPHSPHRNIKCVRCHVGTGVSGLVKAKVNGTWEMISVTFDLFERPIPVPAHPSLPPSEQTCQKCHSPTEPRGTKIKTFVKHQFDEHSTPRYTTVALKLGEGHGPRPTKIHWHTAHPDAVQFVPADKSLKTIRWVDALDQDGTFRRYSNTRLKNDKNHPSLKRRTMDCIDCHSRPAHRFQDPARAIDEAIATGAIDRRIPFIKKVAYAALTGTFRPDWSPNRVIDQAVRGYYAWEMPKAYHEHYRQIERAIRVLQRIYARNVHPAMKVGWNTYPDNIGHRGNHGGCFRCHNEDMRDQNGKAIRHDCSLCHDLLAYDSPTPFEAFDQATPDVRQRTMYRWFRRQYAEDHHAPAFLDRPQAPKGHPAAAPPNQASSATPPASSSGAGTGR